MYAAVRIRGGINMNPKTKKTLEILNLRKVNQCVLLPEEPGAKGMLRKAQNWIAWGEASKEIESKLKNRLEGSKVARLSPPSKGYKSAKAHYPKGSLGYMGEKVNGLLERMI